MPLTPSEWDQRFQQQAAWTQDLRSYLYPKTDLKNARRVLEVGCGTGAVTGELAAKTRGKVYGLDLDIPRLKMAMRNTPAITHLGGDAHALPFRENSFDLTLSHFLLLWVDDPVKAVREMGRVTRPGGSILALAEPDYGGRLDHPPPLTRLKTLQTEALRRQGANPHLGRALRSIFSLAGCREIVTGVLGGQWQSPPTPEELALEWKVIAADLEDTLSTEELETLRELESHAWEREERTLFVPTFYAWGKV